MNCPVIIEKTGKLSGRDAIYLDEVEFTSCRELILKGEFNGSLCEKKQTQKWIGFNLSFYSVLFFNVIELDFYQGELSSSFDQILNSNQIMSWRSEK